VYGIQVGQSDQITITIPAAGKTSEKITLLVLSVKVLAKNNSTLRCFKRKGFNEGAALRGINRVREPTRRVQLPKPTTGGSHSYSEA
jgi:hypothetical protein